MKPTLFVDVDSTIYDLDPMLVRATRAITGEELSEGEINEWNFLHNRYGGETAHEIFARALAPELVHTRKLYPGCARFLGMMHDMGCEIVFATHNHDPDGMRDALVDWIWSHFFPAEILITTSEHSKVEELLRRDAPLGIIDDKPQTIREAVNAQLLTMTIEQPWNLSTIHSCRPHVVHFAVWDELTILTHPFWGAMNARFRKMKEEGVYA